MSSILCVKNRAARPILFLAALFLSCFPGPVRAEGIPVFVSIGPQKYFVERIAGDLARVSVMVSPGMSPAAYEPRPRQMADLARARVYFSIGVPFETVWLDRFRGANPGLLIVPTDHGIEKIPMAAHHHGDKHIGEAHHGEVHHEKAHGTPDPHIWLCPPLVKIQARTIADAFIRLDPANAAAYQRNLERFTRELDDLDHTIRGILAPVPPPRTFMVFHPSWGYFARAYGLTQEPIEVEGKEPKPAELKSLIEEAREEHIRVVFVQPQFSRKSAEVIARSIGGRVVAVNPLAMDWADNLLKTARVFREAMNNG